MIEIEFRGKSIVDIENDELQHLDRGNWVYGNLIQDGNKTFIVRGIVDVNESGIQLEEWCEVDQNTVGQYTGLKDKHGKKIYKGDIVRDNDNLIMKVIWRYNSWQFEVIKKTKYTNFKYSDVHYWFESEVYVEFIGNIHDNPELLEE